MTEVWMLDSTLAFGVTGTAVRRLEAERGIEDRLRPEHVRAEARGIEPARRDARVVLERNRDRLLERYALDLLVARRRLRHVERGAARDRLLPLVGQDGAAPLRTRRREGGLPDRRRGRRLGRRLGRVGDGGHGEHPHPHHETHDHTHARRLLNRRYRVNASALVLTRRADGR
jgi:hypothetical protein